MSTGDIELSPYVTQAVLQTLEKNPEPLLMLIIAALQKDRVLNGALWSQFSDLIVQATEHNIRRRPFGLR